MPARVQKSLKCKKGFPHREHRSKGGRGFKFTRDKIHKKIQKELENKEKTKEFKKELIKLKQKI